MHALLEHVLALSASDLHLSAGQVPRVRVDGQLVRMSTAAPNMAHGVCATPLSHKALYAMLCEVMDEAQRTLFAQGHEQDLAFTVPALGRFRVNAFMQQHGCAAVLRHIPSHTPTLEALGAPPVLASLLQQVGLLLVTGPTGSGKSTTLAAMVQQLNTQRALHIVTLEDPIEFVHTSARSLISQREIGRHSHSFAQALRAALREDPDVILVGELRDIETIRLALTAAETGHLVLASLHTRSAAATVERVVDVFDAPEKAMVRTQLSEALVGVVSQDLWPRAKGSATVMGKVMGTKDGSASGAGRVAVFETLVATPAIRHLIREGKTAQMQSTQQTGAAHGMQTMQQALQAAQREGKIDQVPDEATRPRPI